MDTIKALQKHIQKISKFQKANLDKEVNKFISENPNLNETELLDKIYSVYGSRIKTLEDATHCKAIIDIKEWVATLGIFVVIGIILWIINFAVLSTVK